MIAAPYCWVFNQGAWPSLWTLERTAHWANAALSGHSTVGGVTHLHFTKTEINSQRCKYANAKQFLSVSWGTSGIWSDALFRLRRSWIPNYVLFCTRVCLWFIMFVLQLWVTVVVMCLSLILQTQDRICSKWPVIGFKNGNISTVWLFRDDH